MKTTIIKTSATSGLKLTGKKSMIEKLEKMMNVEEIKLNTVKEYIENHPESVISERVSKKGVKLITVALPTGTKELQLERILNNLEII